MMASKTAGKSPMWRRRWVWMSIAALVIFLAGTTVGGGGGHSDESRCDAAATAVDHG